MSADARSAVLSRIQTALGGHSHAAPEEVAAEWTALPRNYDRTARLALSERLDLLEDRLKDYGAEITHVTDREVASAITAILTARGTRRTLLPHGFPSLWRPADFPLTFDEEFSALELEAFDAVVTGATLAIAETGSLVLLPIPGQGRRAATLVPDFHLCVLRVKDIVENVPEAFARLATQSTLPITFVSGPSATADIEMTRIKGVHGPRFLHVLLVSADRG